MPPRKIKPHKGRSRAWRPQRILGGKPDAVRLAEQRTEFEARAAGLSLERDGEGYVDTDVQRLWAEFTGRRRPEV